LGESGFLEKVNATREVGFFMVKKGKKGIVISFKDYL